jgi:hypothetical protein
MHRIVVSPVRVAGRTPATFTDTTNGRRLDRQSNGGCHESGLQMVSANVLRLRFATLRTNGALIAVHVRVQQRFLPLRRPAAQVPAHAPVVLDEGRQRRRGYLPRMLERAFAEPVMQHAAWRVRKFADVRVSRFFQPSARYSCCNRGREAPSIGACVAIRLEPKPRTQGWKPRRPAPCKPPAAST